MEMKQESVDRNTTSQTTSSNVPRQTEVLLWGDKQESMHANTSRQKSKAREVVKKSGKILPKDNSHAIEVRVCDVSSLSSFLIQHFRSRRLPRLGIVHVMS